ncbi:hypothetical protein [Streptomyces sp. NPDC058989]|uniref:hypothetical protein n=1 Tax=Streptomyces sp. NPDC058989 TaxID=3346686 RepID=UPI0036C2FB5F
MQIAQRLGHVFSQFDVGRGHFLGFCQQAEPIMNPFITGFASEFLYILLHIVRMGLKALAQLVQLVQLVQLRRIDMHVVGHAASDPSTFLCAFPVGDFAHAWESLYEPECMTKPSGRYRPPLQNPPETGQLRPTSDSSDAHCAIHRPALHTLVRIPLGRPCDHAVGSGP